MDIPVNAEVHCADGRCGRSTYVILNPTTEQITHLVVKAVEPPHTEFLVPVSLVVRTAPDRIWLECTAQELAGMEPFVDTEYIQAQLPEAAQPPTSYMQGQYLMWPYFVPDLEQYVPVERKHIPPHERAVHRGTQVVATDGHVGQVDEFLVDPAAGHITHLVLREGHLFGHRDVSIPVSEIERIDGDTVHLKLDKHAVGALPAIPVRRE
jgi:sporulation protein YlmC with PRC-barrel domain